MKKIRVVQALALAAVIGPDVATVWFIDSRFHEFEAQINARPRNFCASIGGLKIEDELEGWVNQILTILKPLRIIDDSAGNNVLAKEPLDQIVDLKSKAIAKFVAVVGWKQYICTTVANVGTEIDKAIPGANEKVNAFNTWLLSVSPKLRIADFASKFSPQGYLDPVYDCGDHVHFNESAWTPMAQIVDSFV